MNKEKKIGIIFAICLLLILAISIILMYPVYQSTSEINQEKQNLQNELDIKETELTNLNSQIINTKNELINTRDSLNKTSSELEMRKLDGIYEFYDPEYSDLIKFISRDKTNRERYDDETFNCVHYALGLNNNSEIKGYRCAFVFVDMSVSGHACVAFETRDKGIIFIEPQTDQKVDLRIGDDYWSDCISSRYKSDRDNTVEGYELFW